MVQRGKQRFYDSLIECSLEPLGNERRNMLIDRRDRAIVARYYYHAKVLRKRWDDTMMSLVGEFYLSSEQIVKRMGMQEEYLLELINGKTDPGVLKREFDHYNWSGVK